MQFDLPLFFEKKYIDFILENNDKIYSIYYRLPTNNNAFDARNAKQSDLFPFKDILQLEKFPNTIKKYGLLNSKVVFPEFYGNEKVENVISTISQLFETNVLNGLLITDFMYLQKLHERMPSKLVSEIEIVPSVNVKLNNVKQISHFLGHIQELDFKLPSKIILDRSLNRNPNKLKEIRKWQRNNYPNVKIEILVNEGCLPYCPYKDSHDIFISLFNQRKENEILEIFRQNGCRNIFKQHWYYLTTPFVRPEDIKYLFDYVDVLKIAGRTHNAEFIINTYNAYFREKWEGNLLKLLDTSYLVSDNIYIDNSLIPKQFYSITSSCNLNCNDCSYCKRIFESSQQN